MTHWWGIQTVAPNFPASVEDPLGLGLGRTARQDVEVRGEDQDRLPARSVLGILDGIQENGLRHAHHGVDARVHEYDKDVRHILPGLVVFDEGIPGLARMRVSEKPVRSYDQTGEGYVPDGRPRKISHSTSSSLWATGPAISS